MLNLVQLQERLKGIPMQALMQYANGSNPQVPPFLALGELNRRKKMQEEASADQAQQMEGAPSIKDQIEQSTGLLALQGNRQRQAAQQQQAAQQAMPMAAPNTTTSEPAQMAGGGFVDDLVVPRDYQMGGQVQPQINPEMLKRLMMLKAMKQRQGLQGIRPGMNAPRGYADGGNVINPDDLKRAMYREAMQGDVADIPKELLAAARKAALRRAPGLPSLSLSRDMFRRSDYAGGGIVAFEAGGSVKRVSGKTLSEYLASVADALKANTEMTEQEKIDSINRAKEQFINSPADPGTNSPDQEPEGRTASGLPREARGMRISAPNQQIPSPGLESLLSRQASPSMTGTSALRRAMAIDPSQVFQAPEPRSIEDIIADQRRRQEMMGIGEDFIGKKEQALSDIQARRQEERAQQPMDRLMEFLAGVTEGRGGNWATQGARGAKAAMALEAQQKALRDKQDMEMAELKYTLDAKRDAIRRGDLQSAEALEGKEKELKRDMIKNQADMAIRQAQVETQGRQAEANILQATKPTDWEKNYNLYLQHAKEKGLTPTAEGFQKFMLGTKASTVTTMEDAIRIAAQTLGQGASMQEIQQRATELLRLATGQGAGTTGSRTVDFSQLPKK